MSCEGWGEGGGGVLFYEGRCLDGEIAKIVSAWLTDRVNFRSEWYHRIHSATR